MSRGGSARLGDWRGRTQIAAGLMGGPRGSAGVFRDMRAKGLGDRCSWSARAADNPGDRRCFLRSARQHCVAHSHAQSREGPGRSMPASIGCALEGDCAPTDGTRPGYADLLPSALACFEDDSEACLAHLRLPVTHRPFVRTTNFLERMFVEEQRRLKSFPTASARSPCSSSCSALIRAAERWRGPRLTEFDLRQIGTVKTDFDHEYQTSTSRWHGPLSPGFSSKPLP
jgi:putative transposase